MADKTGIEWTEATWNPITGCSVVSPGCTNCYAMKLAGTRLQHHPSRAGLTRESKAGPVWTGEVRLNEGWIDQPLRWRRARMIFVCAHGDLFHEGVPDEWIDKVFAVMALAPQHVFQVLTKRPARMRDYVKSIGQNTGKPDRITDIALDLGYRTRGYRGSGGLCERPLPNVWLGTSVEDQARADERIPLLLDTPAAVRWISAEPLLGPIDLTTVDLQRGPHDGDDAWLEPLTGRRQSLGGAMTTHDIGKLDWIVVGGESGPGARPMHPDWARSLRDQCAAAGVAFHFKQHGHWSAVYDRDREDPDWRRCDVIARRTPQGRWLNLAGGQGFHGDRVVRVAPIGKKAAGRLLDGVEHNGMPACRA